MILCPNCLHQEMVGALFCSECGTQLVFKDGVPTTTIKQSSPLETKGYQVEQTKLRGPAPPPPTADTVVSLNIISSGEILSLQGRTEVTLGRVSKGQPVVPDIDLTPYKAYEAGVSRMHASITIKETLITVTDLGSVNGTRINGRQITAHIPYPIKNGDILTLGKFKIQILLRNR